jgi:hypothetical protein
MFSKWIFQNCGLVGGVHDLCEGRIKSGAGGSVAPRAMLKINAASPPN